MSSSTDAVALVAAMFIALTAAAGCEEYDPPPDAKLVQPEGGAFAEGEVLRVEFSEPIAAESLVVRLWPAERDIENAHKYAIKNFAESLLPVIDSMEMGQTAAVAENATLDSIREGSELTMNMLNQVLERTGLQQFDPLGEKFDPEKHQAISMVEVADAESGSIIQVMQKGFQLNERLIRPAMVVVAK